jgi:antagonist of KipI
VDRGRTRTRSLGVPVGGPADAFALALGNGLVGNPPDTPALEVCLSGPTLICDEDLACVVFGAPFGVRAGNRRLAANRTFTLRAGEELLINGTPQGMRAYLCVRGGFDAPLVLGSRSALQPLTPGDRLHCTGGTVTARGLVPRFDWNAEPRLLRFVSGPQESWFPPDGFDERSMTVTPASDRMGLRLRGEPLQLPGREMVSEPVCPGTVQVTGNGQCIVLGVDGQTIGGYPKIAQVIAADLDKLAQLRPGDAVTFQRVSVTEAEALYRRKRAELNDWLLRLSAAESL